MASVINAIDQLKFHPSYPTPAALTQDVLNDPNGEKDIMHIRSGLFEPQLHEIVALLPKWKEERPHGPKAPLSTHDTSALTGESSPPHGAQLISSLELVVGGAFRCACCICVPLHHSDPVSFPCSQGDTSLRGSPAIFELRDLNDNLDLQRVAGRLLAMITGITPSLDLIDPLMTALTSILKDSAVSLNHDHRMSSFFSRGGQRCTVCRYSVWCTSAIFRSFRNPARRSVSM